MAQTELKIEDLAALLPSTLFTASAESTDDSRGIGLILTKDNIKKLKAYEIAGLALPTTLKDVITYLGYERGAGLGLEASDFQQTFTLINTHARLWNPLRTDLMTVNDKLVGFAGSMQIYGESVTEVLNDIKALAMADDNNIETLEDLRKVEATVGKFPEIKLTDREDIGYYLDEILKQVREQTADALNIKKRLDAFGKQLAEQVKPAITLKIKGINTNTLGAEIKTLQTAIDNRALAIDEKQKEYNKLVTDAVKSVTNGGLIMMIYSSVQAEKTRKARNALQDQQAADITSISTKDAILGSLNSVRDDLQKLEGIVLDADCATKNLITVWNGLNTYLSQSSAAVLGITDGLSMRRFRDKFSHVVQPWKNIEEDAKKLRDVFAEADLEFKLEYGN